MIPDIDFIQTCFGRFNAQIFGGSLPIPPLKLTRAASFFGKVHYRRHRNLLGKEIKSDFEIRISTSFDLPEREWEDVIIHEMLHYYIDLNGIRDSSAHGPVFRSMMQQINEKYGRQLTVSKRTAVPRQRRKRTGASTFCISILSDGSRGITICSPARVSYMKRYLPRYYRLQQMQWHSLESSVLDRYPKSIKPRIYRLRDEDYLKLQEALIQAEAQASAVPADQSRP